MNATSEMENRRLRYQIGEVQGKNERLKHDLAKLRRQHEDQGRCLQGLQGAVDELLRELDQFFDDENRTIWDIKTAISLVKAAR